MHHYLRQKERRHSESHFTNIQDGAAVASQDENVNTHSASATQFFSETVARNK